MKVFNENVFASLIKILAGGKFRRALRDAEKVVQDNPGLEAEIEQFAVNAEKLKRDMEKFCKNNPDDPLCSRGSRSRITDIEY